ncbi:YpdA family putative bacillithiol disulfide reductase [Alkalicoccus halolimnae]|uniref:YpdA family putative bacillithiol disulfide reductase n=1 Tax=Alkalicoccus halolimnae TaxID=1667239 RepID=A0A5C7F4I5_9BACI|nr:YpdA family putative bacillithiol disulfide reductase [Alkalicoccus halolimnae]TXF83026.1 YpdA family putative bacillithiol disulfide reductase [Alkalicoccus halolimnae]
MQQEKVIIIGGGPCGLSAAIELQMKGLNPLIIEKGNLVHSIYKYPTHQQFFSTSEKLSVGGIPFYSTERKPKRNEALVYYRKVAEEKEVRINSYEEVIAIEEHTDGGNYKLSTESKGETKEYLTEYIVVATGYYDSPNSMNIPGEELPHVYHYFHEAHPYFGQKVAVIGGKNSAVDAALELEKAGAEVTVFYRGSDYSPSIKPWILPEFESLVKNEKIRMYFNTSITNIERESIFFLQKGMEDSIKVDFVFAMTGYHPDHSFIRSMGVQVDDASGRPDYSPLTMETNKNNIFIAGVIAAGNNANEIFIENGRWHGQYIAEEIYKKEVQKVISK